MNTIKAQGIMRTGRVIPALVTFLFATVASADGVLEEITVTAQKREQSLQDVGISVAAFSADLLDKLGYDQTTDIEVQTPALRIQSFHPLFTTINIRGVSQNDFTDHLEAPIALYFDEVYDSIIYAAQVDLFDMERVEVLRGPQGTLFGRNATGGLIHFISRKPTDALEGFVDLTLGDYSQVWIEGALSGPLSDGISGRLSFASNTHDGYLKNHIGKDKYNLDSQSFRAQLQFNPSESFEAWFKVAHNSVDTVGNGYPHNPSTLGPDGLGTFIGRDELGVFHDFAGGTFTTCPGCDAFAYREPDPDFHSTTSDFQGTTDRSVTSYTAKLTGYIGDLTLESISDYTEADKYYSEDSDGSPIAQLVFYQSADSSQFSQELRVRGESENTTWIGGLYYLETEHTTWAETVEDLGELAGFGPVPPGTIMYESSHDSVIKSDSWAVFGQVEYDFAEDWSLVAALRYTEDDRKLDWTLEDNFGSFERLSPTTAFSSFFDPVAGDFVTIPSDVSLATQSFENTSAKLGLNWLPNEDWLVYASYNRGHKAGNFATPYIGPLVDLSIIPHGEEILTSYEAGFKATLMEGRARLNASFYYYDYQDYQGSFYFQLVQIVRNLDADAIGGELEFVVTPTDGLDIMLGASWIDSKVENVGLPSGEFVDRDLPMTSDWTFNGMARYEWPIGDWSMAVQGDFRYVDGFCFTLVCNHTEVEDGYLLANARVSFSDADGQWTLAGFINNLTNEDYRVNALDISSVGLTISVPGPPRWYGVSIAYHW